MRGKASGGAEAVRTIGSGRAAQGEPVKQLGWSQGPVHVCGMMRRGVGGGQRARGVVLVGLGVVVTLLVACSGQSSAARETSTQTATPAPPESTAAGARREEPAAPSGDEHGHGTQATTTAQPSPPANDDAAEPAGRGSIHETMNPEPGVVAPPVGIEDVAVFGNGVWARLADIESIEAEGHLPGERSGPAVAVSVQVTNLSSGPIDLDIVTVDLTTADGVSAYGVVVPDRPPLAGDLAAGETASGEYVFTLAPGDRTDVQIRVKYSANTATVVFEGSIADG
jgi:hypothetical protein